MSDSAQPKLIAQAGHDTHEAQGPAPSADTHIGEPDGGSAMHVATGDHATTATAHAEGHGEGASDVYTMPPFPPNFASLIHAWKFKTDPEYAQKFTLKQEKAGHHVWAGGRLEPSHDWFINPLYSIFYALIIILVVRKAFAKPNLERPGRFQSAVEGLLGGLRNFFVGITGPDGAKFFPFIGSLWLFILLNNMMVLVPGFKAPSYSFKTTIALGLCVFVYVHYNSFKYLGFKKWFLHLLGQPNDVITWALSPLFFFLEVIGTLIKPLSLALRLFGNIFGEDKLLASFLGMGMLLMGLILGTDKPPVGIPLHLPFYFLVLLLSTIQATVFSLLAAIYIMQLQPHDHHDHDDEHEAGHPHHHAADHGAHPATHGAAV